MIRHKELSLRQPERTFLSRTSSDNKTNTITSFTNLLEKLYKTFNFAANMTWVLDDTSYNVLIMLGWFSHKRIDIFIYDEKFFFALKFLLEQKCSG